VTLTGRPAGDQTKQHRQATAPSTINISGQPWRSLSSPLLDKDRPAIKPNTMDS
jgi:hypothetical protein